MKTKKLRVILNVTKTGIKEGVPGEPRYCPIARAMKAQGFKDVEVADEVNGRKNGIYWSGQATDKMQRFIGKFDDHETVSPTTFAITLVADVDDYEETDW